MKRSTSRFSLVFVLAVAAYFVFFHFKPEGSTSSPPGQGSAGAEENKTAQVSRRLAIPRDRVSGSVASWYRSRHPESSSFT